MEVGVWTCTKPILWLKLFCWKAHNHRNIQIGRHHWRTSGPANLVNQGQLEQVAKDRIQMALRLSKDGDSTASLGCLCQCLVTCTIKKCFLMFRPPVFQFLPIASSVTEHLWKEPDSVLLTPSHQIFIHIYKMPLSLLFSRLTSSISQPFLVWHAPIPRLSSLPFTWPAVLCPCLSCAGEPWTRIVTPGVALTALSRWEGSPLSGFWQRFS